MVRALLLFSDLSFPYSVVDRGIGWASQSKGSLVAVFFSSPEAEAGPDHGTSGSNAPGRRTMVDDKKILDSYISILKQEAVVAGIDLQINLVSGQSQEEILEYLIDCVIIFISQEDREFFLLSHTLIDLIHKSSVPIEWIR